MKCLRCHQSICLFTCGWFLVLQQGLACFCVDFVYFLRLGVGVKGNQKDNPSIFRGSDSWENLGVVGALKDPAKVWDFK